jgi:hypothetical protein
LLEGPEKNLSPGSHQISAVLSETALYFLQVSLLRPFLAAFAKLQKETISFVMAVRPSVGMEKLPLDGFS